MLNELCELALVPIVAEEVVELRLREDLVPLLELRVMLPDVSVDPYDISRTGSSAWKSDWIRLFWFYGS